MDIFKIKSIDEMTEEEYKEYEENLIKNYNFDNSIKVNSTDIDDESYYIVDNSLEENEYEKNYENNFDNFLNEWDIYYEQFSWNNPIPSKLSLHLLLSQTFKDIIIMIRGQKIDNRISCLIIQTQGTGKTAGADCIKDFIKAVDKIYKSNQDFKIAEQETLIKINSIDSFSDAGLIGTFREIPVSKLNPSGKIIEIKGIFDKSNSDIIYSGEARKILASDKINSSSEVLQYINIGLNSKFTDSNIIIKTLRNGKITCNITASFLLTTYPTELISLESLRSGFYRRLLTYYNDLDLEEIKKNSIKYDNSIISTSEKEKKKEEIIINTKLHLARKYYSFYLNYIKKLNNGKIYLGMSKDIEIFLIAQTIDYVNHLNQELNIEEAKLMMAYYNSYKSYALIIASHRALINNMTIIRRDDILYAFKIIKPILRNLEIFIKNVYKNNLNFYQNQELNKDKNIKEFIKNTINKNNKSIKRSDLIIELQKNSDILEISKNVSVLYKLLDKLKKEKFINIENLRNSSITLYDFNLSQ